MASTFSNMLDLVYPTGSIFQSMNDNHNPQTLFGGNWGAIDGYFLQSVATSTANANTAIGGNAVTLTVNNLPSHVHSIAGAYTSSSGSDGAVDYILYNRWSLQGRGWYYNMSGDGTDTDTDMLPLNKQCLSKSFSIIPRSKTCHAWNRTS